jgi:hypothetical protein
MILGLSVAAFTKLHVAICLVAILSGLVTLLAMIGSRNLRAGTALFLITTVLTSVTGYFFHSTSFGPPHVVGAISLVALAVAIWARYVRRMAGVWRPAYVISATAALYLNCFVAVVQAFQKIPALNALAPNGTEPPFLVAQGVLLLAAILLGFMAVRSFHPKPAVA